LHFKKTALIKSGFFTTGGKKLSLNCVKTTAMALKYEKHKIFISLFSNRQFKALF